MNIPSKQGAARDRVTEAANGATEVATMFSNLRRRFARRLSCARRATDPASPGPSPTELERHQVLRALGEARDAGRKVTLREIHRLAHLSQPAALRCVRELEQAGGITIEAVDHDPLSGEIRLA